MYHMHQYTRNLHTSKIRNLLPVCLINASSRPHSPVACTIWWKSVKNCRRNRSTTICFHSTLVSAYQPLAAAEHGLCQNSIGRWNDLVMCDVLNCSVAWRYRNPTIPDSIHSRAAGETWTRVLQGELCVSTTPVWTGGHTQPSRVHHQGQLVLCFTFTVHHHHSSKNTDWQKSVIDNDLTCNIPFTIGI